ncbi:hypothetical protein [Inquilinus sp. CA228]|uniref:hypothetical protein n=1 Tax=Inquilinus sp. CA228 TaxID=3455609 RepID=UPI003F8D6D05
MVGSSGIHTHITGKAIACVGSTAGAAALARWARYWARSTTLDVRAGKGMINLR